jgi:hypothetical protein
MSFPRERIDNSASQGNAECNSDCQREPPDPHGAGFAQPLNEPASLRGFFEKPPVIPQRSAAQYCDRTAYK